MIPIGLICNIVLLALTGGIVLTEGLPGNRLYLALTLLMLVVPLLNAMALVRRRQLLARLTAPGRELVRRSLADGTVAMGNVILLSASAWAAVAQYPYVEGRSVIPFAVLAVCTPLLTLIVLLRSTMGGMRDVRPSTVDNAGGSSEGGSGR